MQIGKLTKWLSGIAVALALGTAAQAQTQTQYGSLDRIAFQFVNQQGQRSGGSSIVGDWHRSMQTGDGGVLHMYWRYAADGNFLYTSIQLGGAPGANGTRTQVWGRYETQPQQNGSVVVTYKVNGHAPMQTCMQGQGCHPNATLPSDTMRGTFRIHGNIAESDGSSMQRDTVPQALQAQLPATWNLQPPPPLPAPTVIGGPGTTNRPQYHVPGQGGTCDNLQEQRKCTINDGQMYVGRDGCEHCSK